MKRMQITEELQETTIALAHGNKAVLRRTACGKTDLLSVATPYAGAYGMGEKFNGLNQKGRDCVNKVVEKFCHQGEFTYLSSPFFVTNTGIGIYIDTQEETTFSFQEQITCILPHEAAVIVFTGTVAEIISDYMLLFGPAKLPPAYAFGIWISANRWNSQRAVEEQLRLLEQYHFPASVLVLEAWSDEATFYLWNGADFEAQPDGKALRYEDFDFSKSAYWNDPRGMIERLHEKNIRLVLWQIPVYKEQDSAEALSRQLLFDKEDAVKRELCVRRADGSPYTIPQGNWFGGSLIPDFTNPLTREVWFAKRQYLLDIGVDGFKTDGGEFIYEDNLVLWDKRGGAAVKNGYAQCYTQAYSDFIGEGRVLFSRAGFAGAHRTPAHWGGDQQSENRELKSVLQAGLSAAMTGILFWGFDIAGFAGELPTPDLYRRATQLACFVPIMQWHSEPDGGQFKEPLPGMLQGIEDMMPPPAGASEHARSTYSNNERSPWNIASAGSCPELLDEMRFWHNLRMNLQPYLYSTALACCLDSKPMMRPLVYDWSMSAEAVMAEDEYLLGDSLLIAPLLEENERTRSVWFPDGEWYGLLSRRRQMGGRREQSREEDRFPVYLRSGYALALQGSARTGLEILDESIPGGSALHFLLAGKEGRTLFRNEAGQLEMSWKDDKVSIAVSSGNMEGVHLTWEFIHEIVKV